ncbi:serine/threonine protein kinase [Streptomyces hygroscopicus subsp. hygroscopicus]|nr:class III lanthionine synthetase LanKC [Streptomyces hygroscopicus]GLX51447.1 serine/threonine protein kinase [Streptomyces hygroscopicus subsp. hygroscopicus]
MFDVLGEVFADKEYYAPLAAIDDPGPRFAPGRVPAGWRGTAHDIWTVWRNPQVRPPERGWKIHVSARLDRAQHVLDVVADTCFAENTPFKHASARFFFLFLHHKHGARSQSGKFCTVYPPDSATARRLLDLLSQALEGEEGAYVLSDRRYRDSRTVHYRFGAFGGRSRLLPDGTREPLVRDGFGRDVVDVRLPAFVLPDGIVDPFVTEEQAEHEGPILIRHYEIVKVLQPSNAGGAYQARDTRTGRLVLVKEARAHNGYTWDGTSARERLRHEHEVLAAVHGAIPGVGPEPLDHFTEWEHDFLVMEHVEGLPLPQWMGRAAPLLKADGSPRDFAGYYAGCRRILRSLDTALERLHCLGYRFGDINPGNVIVTPAGDARFVDFEAVSATSDPPAAMGTPGFTAPSDLTGDGTDPFVGDRYGMAATALTLLAPLYAVPEPVSANLALLRRDLTAAAPVPDDLWARATAFQRSPEREAAVLPTPAELDADPLACLGRVAEQIAAGLLDMADSARTDWVFPPPPMAFRTNTVCVAYGTAGVVHALHRAGAPVPDAVEKRLRRDAQASREELPPGLAVGSAGIARVLAALGHLDEAIDLARTADSHPLTASSTTLAGGRAGVGLAWLALHQRTGDVRHLERAAAAGDAILRTADLGSTLGAHDARGLFHGRAGLAHFLHYLARDTGDERYREAGRRLLHEELDRAVPLPDGSLSFSENALSGRVMPFLAEGSAGVGTVLVRYAATSPDERCTAALPLVVADTRKVYAREPGLYGGLAGMVCLLADHADLTDDARDRQDAVRVATGLVKYAVPHGRGIRYRGGNSLRFSADVSSGSAGVLLALQRVVHAQGDELFTLDRHGSAIEGRR